MSDKPGFKTGETHTRSSATEGNHVDPKATQEKPRVDTQLFGNDSITATGSRAGKSPKEVEEHFKELVKRIARDPNAQHVNVMLVDDSNLDIPAIVIYSVYKDVVFYHTLLLESLGVPLRNKPETAMGYPIEIDMFTYMYYDDDMKRVVAYYVEHDAAARGIKYSQMLDLNATVIPSHVDYNTIDTVEDALAPYFDSALSAIRGNYKAAMGVATSNKTAAVIGNANCRLVARSEITPGSTYRTPHGELTAGDFCINLVAQKNNQKRQSIHGSGKEEAISKAVGYVDFAYRETPPQQQQMYGQQAVRPIYYDTFIVLTDVSPLGQSAKAEDSLLTTLLGISSIATTVAEGKWINVFNTSSMDSGAKTTIGALGLEHNIYEQGNNPKVLEVSSGDMQLVPGTENTLTPTQVAMDYCSIDTIIALDCVLGGPQSWIHNMLSGCTLGSRAEAVVAKELDGFSGGLFSQIWNFKEPMVSSKTNDVFLGTYQDETYGERDIRSLDYLSTLKASQGDINIMKPYSDACAPGGTNKLVMDRMRKLIMQRAPTAKITGLARRTYFNINFINAVIETIRRTGLELRTEGIGEIDLNQQRGTTFAGMGAGPMSGMHNTYQQGMQQGQTVRPGVMPGVGLFS